MRWAALAAIVLIAGCADEPAAPVPPPPVDDDPDRTSRAPGGRPAADHVEPTIVAATGSFDTGTDFSGTVPIPMVAAQKTWISLHTTSGAYAEMNIRFGNCDITATGAVQNVPSATVTAEGWPWDPVGCGPVPGGPVLTWELLAGTAKIAWTIEIENPALPVD